MAAFGYFPPRAGDEKKHQPSDGRALHREAK
jgi:hypothetical protein